MEEVIFMVEENTKGRLIANGLGVSIYTEADTIEELRINVKDTLLCHFDDGRKRIIRLRIIREEIIV